MIKHHYFYSKILESKVHLLNSDVLDLELKSDLGTSLVPMVKNPSPNAGDTEVSALVQEDSICPWANRRMRPQLTSLVATTRKPVQQGRPSSTKNKQQISK